jgi:hypothetical protein
MNRWCQVAAVRPFQAVRDSLERPSYAISSVTGLIFAQRSGIDEMSEGFRGRARMDSTHLVAILLGLAAVVLVVWLLSYFSGSRRRPAAYHSPGRLFLAIAKGHRLSWRETWLLWRVARWHRLEDPARLFLEPDRFDRENLGASLMRHAARLQSLRGRLFAGLVRPEQGPYTA